MEQTAQRLEILLSVKEVADLVGGSSSSVSTWKKRYPESFSHVEKDSLLDAEKLIAWLEQKFPRNRSIDPGREWWWQKASAAYTKARGIEHGRRNLVALVLIAHRLWSTDDGRAVWARVISGATATAAATSDEREFGDGPGELRAAALREEASDRRLIGLLVEPIDSLATDPLLPDLLVHLNRWNDPSSAPGLIDAALSADDTAQSAGRLTNVPIARLMVALAGLSNGGSVIDPAAGDGEILVQCARMSRIQGNDVQLTGKEIDDTSWRIARSRLVVEAVDADLGQRPGDSLAPGCFAETRVDAVLIDPPLESQSSSGSRAAEPPLPPLAEWLRFGIDHLADDGRLVVLIPTRALEGRGRGQVPEFGLAEVTERLARGGAIESVVVLPPRTRVDLPGEQAIWVIRRQRDEEQPAPVRVVMPTSTVDLRRSAKEGAEYADFLSRVIVEDPAGWVARAEASGAARTSMIPPDQLTRALRNPEAVVGERRAEVRGRRQSTPVGEQDGIEANLSHRSDDTELREELRVMQQRLSDIRGKAEDLAEALDEPLRQLRRTDPNRYQHIQDRLEALMRRV